MSFLNPRAGLYTIYPRFFHERGQFRNLTGLAGFVYLHAVLSFSFTSFVMLMFRGVHGKPSGDPNEKRHLHGCAFRLGCTQQDLASFCELYVTGYTTRVWVKRQGLFW